MNVEQKLLEGFVIIIRKTRFFHFAFISVEILDIMLVFNVNLEGVPVLVDLATVRTSNCLTCTRMYILQMATKVLGRNIFMASLAENLT